MTKEARIEGPGNASGVAGLAIGAGILFIFALLGIALLMILLMEAGVPLEAI